MKRAFEINFDGIVGPTHNYSGLSWGNEASNSSYNETSNPQQAALQGLAKMKFLMDLGLKQGFFLPQERPLISILNAMGFIGTTESIVAEAKKKTPWVFNKVSSASSMWAANAATVTPSTDSASQKVQFTTANLHNKFHRSIEAEATTKQLKLIFPNPVFFEHHGHLPQHHLLSDEGAANHARVAKSHADPGIHIFGYGNTRITDDEVEPQKFPARQSKQASEAISRQHKIYEKQVVISQINPHAIDEGVFHMDVCLTSNENVMMLHENTFHKQPDTLNQIRSKLEAFSDANLIPLIVPRDVIPLDVAVKSYLFNSQIITLPDGKMNIIAPAECIQFPSVTKYIAELVESRDNPITEAHYINLRQSMKNGGGPACLRLRVTVNETELEEVNPKFLLTEELYKSLVLWVKKHYRTSLLPEDLSDPKFIEENFTALDELTSLLDIGPIYDFQK